MRLILASLAVLCVACVAQAQTYTDQQGTTYQLETVRVCDGNSCHLEQRWVSVAKAPATTFETSAPAAAMPKTPAQTCEPALAAPAAVEFVRFPVAHAVASRGRGLFHRLLHPLHLFGLRSCGACNCGGTCGGACGLAGCGCR